MDQTVTLADIEWSQLMAILANAQGNGVTWSVVNPLLMKVGEQLRQQSQQNASAQQSRNWTMPGNGLDQTEALEPQEAPRAERRVPRG